MQQKMSRKSYLSCNWLAMLVLFPMFYLNSMVKYFIVFENNPVLSFLFYFAQTLKDKNKFILIIPDKANIAASIWDYDGVRTERNLRKSVLSLHSIIKIQNSHLITLLHGNLLLYYMETLSIKMRAVGRGTPLNLF